MRARGLAVGAGVALAVAAMAARAHAQATGRFDLHTRARQTMALEFDEARAQKLEVELQPTVKVALPARFDLTAIARARTDAFDRIEPGRPDQSTYFPASRPLLLGDAGDLELREFYVTRQFAHAYLTLGKQQVVWGRADGIKLLDVVDPQSYREFILPPFDESRIPLWTMNLEVPVGAFNAQLLWVPDSTVHDLAQTGAAFEITSGTLVPTAPPGVDYTVKNPRRPSGFFTDGDAGMRLAGSAAGCDFTLNYLYHYDDTPVPLRGVRFESDELVTVVVPRYERTHVVGATLADTFGDFTVRGEAAAFTGRLVATNDLFDVDGLVRSDEYAYLMGLDWFAPGNATLVSAQVYQSVMPTLPSRAIRDQVQSIVTLLLWHEFADRAGRLEGMWLSDPERGDGLLRGRVRYELRGGVAMALGADVFYGPQGGIFGEFGGRDRIVMELEESL